MANNMFSLILLRGEATSPMPMHLLWEAFGLQALGKEGLGQQPPLLAEMPPMSMVNSCPMGWRSWSTMGMITNTWTNHGEYHCMKFWSFKR